MTSKEITKFRPVTVIQGLDLDDLYVMAYLHDGYRPTQIAANLGLTGAAISARVKKIQAITGIELYHWNFTTIEISEQSMQLCLCAKNSLVELLKAFNTLNFIEVPSHNNDKCGHLGAAV